MRVLVLSPFTLDTPRSTSYATVQLVQSLADLGHQIDVLCCTRESSHHSRLTGRSIAADSADVIRRWGAHSKLLQQWLRYPARRQVQLIHSIDSTVVPAAMCRMLFGIPFVHSMFNSRSNQHGKWRQSRLNWTPDWETWGAACSLGIIVHCQSLAELAAKRHRNLPVIRADVAGLNSTEANRTASIEDWSTAGEQTVMYVGEIGRDQQLLLDAFTYLAHHRSDVKLVIIGGSPHDIRNCKRRVHTLGIADRVNFLGQIPTDCLFNYLRRATILVAASAEGQHAPLKLYSYLAAGRPIVATRIPAYTQVLHSGLACFVEPTALDLYMGMRRLLSDAPLCRDMAARTLSAAQTSAPMPAARCSLAAFYEELDNRIAHSEM